MFHIYINIVSQKGYSTTIIEVIRSFFTKEREKSKGEPHYEQAISTCDKQRSSVRFGAVFIHFLSEIKVKAIEPELFTDSSQSSNLTSSVT